MARATTRGDNLRLGGLALLGVATALVGLADLIDGIGVGWGVAVLLLAVGILYSAFAQGPVVHTLPVLCAALRCGVGVLAFLVGRPLGYAVLCLVLGLATLAVELAARRMRTHPARAPTPFIRRFP
jgi:hypothetical protein